MLLQLPSLCLAYAVPLVVLLGLYPYAKRITNYPQVLLGIALAFGQLVGAAALGVDPRTEHRPRVRWGICCYYLYNVLSAIIMDTIYARQDLNDDIKASLKSTAILWQNKTKTQLCILSATKVALLIAGGIFMDLHPVYYVPSVVGTSTVLAAMVYWVKLDEPKSCGLWFENTIFYSGLALISGLLAEYLYRISDA